MLMCVGLCWLFVLVWCLCGWCVVWLFFVFFFVFVRGLVCDE